MNLRLDREDVDPDHPLLTWGDIYVNGDYGYCSLEDEVRERVGVPVSVWKIAKRTAIPSGTFDLALQSSPRFGEDTPTILRVPGFDLIRMHGGTTEADTDGCLLVGTRQDRANGTLHGSKTAQSLGAAVVLPAISDLKARIKAALSRHESVRIQVRNAPAWYSRAGIAMPEALA